MMKLHHSTNADSLSLYHRAQRNQRRERPSLEVAAPTATGCRFGVGLIACAVAIQFSLIGSSGMTRPIWSRLALRGIALAILAFFCHGAGTVQSARGQEVQGIYREVYTGITGGTVSQLTNAISFQSGASASSVIADLFEAPADFAESYGQRLRAVLVAPFTGDYTFYISSDDQSVLYLSTDELSANKVLIAAEPEWNGSRDFLGTARRTNATAFFPGMNLNLPANRSINTVGIISLVEGERYYTEVLMKEGGGGDNVSVAWSRPNGTGGQVFEGPIPAAHFRAVDVPPPSIGRQPVSTNVALGGMVLFSVLPGGTGPGPFTFQWRKDDINLTDGSNVTGVNTASLNLDSVTAADEGNYSVIVSSPFGEITSTLAALLVQDPGIGIPPLSQVREAGGSVTFDVTPGGTPPFDYQWQHNELAIDGATDSSLSLINLQSADAGLYSVVVSNANGSVTSSPAMLTINEIATEDSLNPVVNSTVSSLAVQRDGKTVIGGGFFQVAGQSRLYIARLNADGTLDSGFNPGAGGPVSSVALQPDGKILVGGTFTSLGGQPRSYLGRLNFNGTLESTFNPAPNNAVSSVVVQDDGKIVVGGSFTTVGGALRGRLARLNVDGLLDTSFDIGANNVVESLALQADGKILVGGAFSMLGEQVRLGVARLNADGSLDTTFDPGANERVQSLAVQPDGRIIAGGLFTILGGQPRSFIGRLNGDGSLDTVFDPGANAAVEALALQSDGRIMAGGAFTMLGGQSRSYLGRLLADGTPDPTFDPGANGSVSTLAVQPDGRILAGGNFTTLGGQPRSRVGRLENTDPATSNLDYSDPTITWLRSDSSPEFSRTSFESSTDGVVWNLIGGGTRVPGGWQLDGVSLPVSGIIRARGWVSGGFDGSVWSVDALHYHGLPFVISQPSSRTNSAGTTATFQAQVGSTEPLDFQWYRDNVPLVDGGNIAGATTDTLTLAGVLKADEGTYQLEVSNSFGTVPSGEATLTVIEPIIVDQLIDEDTTRNAGGSINFGVTAVGTPPLSYQWYRNGIVVPGSAADSLALDDLQAYHAGEYTAVVSNAHGSATNFPVSLTVNYSLAEGGFDPDAIGTVVDVALQSDGKILVAGDYTTLSGAPIGYIGRLNSDGTLDSGFDPGANGEVSTVALQLDGKILVGGWFSSIGGEPRSYLARINPDGSLDTLFDPVLDSGVVDLAVTSDDKIVVGGVFTSIDGQPRNYVARLNPDGSLDEDFNPGAVDSVFALALQTDGKILVGEYNSSINGPRRGRIRRLNPDGTLDGTFDLAANDGVLAIALQTDGKVLLGGYFGSVSGQSRQEIARLNEDGTLDINFNPGANNTVWSLEVQANGRILVGGHFSRLGGSPRDFLVASIRTEHWTLLLIQALIAG